MDSAVKNYTGEKTQTAVFQELILPVAQEAGFSFTEEDYQQFLSNAVQQMDLDEMDQVAGGGSTRGTALSVCAYAGASTDYTWKMDPEWADCAMHGA